jgi:DNA-binding transcriptional ArsR family regulator
VQDLTDQDQCARILRVLSEPIRLAILRRLSDGACSIGTIAASLDIPHYQASRHVSALASIGVVTRSRNGRAVVCALSGAAPTLDLGCCTLDLRSPPAVKTGGHSAGPG